MKGRIVFLVIVGLALLLGLQVFSEYGRAQGVSFGVSSTQIGVVSLRRLFQQSKDNALYRQKATAEQEKIIVELNKLSIEVEAEQAGLKAFKEGSVDYLAAMKEVFTKQASLQAMREFHKQQMELKDQQFTERFYQDVIRIVRQVAEQKGLALVFEKDEVELPAANASELMMLIRTHKLLYSGGCVDITGEVLSRLDGE